MKLQFVYPVFLVSGLVLIVLAAWWYLTRRHGVAYRYGFTALWLREETHFRSATGWRWFHRVMRLTIAVLLVMALARPRSPDEKTQVDVEGVGIMMALDVSRSMLCFDDLSDQRARFSIAQEEGIRFIERRPYDQFGLILFGAVAATRCPLTSDRTMVSEIIRTTKIGVISDEGTVLAQAIAMGVRRLSASSATSKIMVILTDGEPSPEDRPHLADALSLAQKAHVKLYTIGIGSEGGGYIHHPLGGLVQVESCLQKELLRTLALKTGGAFFEARNQRELAAIYQTIDALEKSVQTEPIYAQWHEWYLFCVVMAAILLLVEYACMAARVIL